MLLPRVLVATGFLGAVGVGIGNDLIPGVEQDYPFCQGVTLADHEGRVFEMRAVVIEVGERHPCLGQPPYVALRVAVDGGAEELIFLGPKPLLDREQIHYLPGQEFLGRVATTQGVAAAVEVDLGEEIVTLWDDDSLLPPPEAIAH